MRTKQYYKIVALLSLILSISSCKAGKEKTQEEPISFKSGDFTLTGTLTLPHPLKDSRKLPAFILVHGSGPQDRDQTRKLANTTLRPFKELAHRLAQKGAAVLRYDKRTFLMKLKGSKNFKNLLPDHFIKDAQAAYHALKKREEIDPNNIYLIGHSQGASFAPFIAKAKGIKFKKIFLIAPAILPIKKLILYQISYQIDHIRTAPNSAQYRGLVTQLKGYLQQFKNGFAKIESKETDEKQVVLGATKAFWKRWMELSKDMEHTITNYRAPLVIIQGGKDLKCPAHLLKTKLPSFKKHDNIKVVFIKAMRHDMYDFVTGGFVVRMINKIWENIRL